MNTDELIESALYWADRRVLEMQTKLHRWAGEDRDRRFDDLFNLVADPNFLLVAWDRVRGNTGARTAGIDGRTARSIETDPGVLVFLDDLREQLRSRTFRPVLVRERMIPRRQAAQARHTNRGGQGCPGITETGPGAHLRTGLPFLFVWVPAEPAGA